MRYTHLVLSKRVLVTGASRGIGRAIALALAEDGWSVAVHYNRDRGAAESLSVELGPRSEGILQANLAEHSAAHDLWEQFAASGPTDALVNNAGVYVPHRFAELNSEELEAMARQMFDINFFSPMRLAHVAGKAFLEQGQGKVLNVASRVGFRGEAGAALYAASKAALINLTRSLAVEWASKGVSVFGIAPGWVNTSMARDGMMEREATILKDIPLGRMATPEDCANAARFFLREESNYLSGMTLDINGASYFH